jgi:hypothetical protein
MWKKAVARHIRHLPATSEETLEEPVGVPAEVRNAHLRMQVWDILLGTAIMASVIKQSKKNMQAVDKSALRDKRTSRYVSDVLLRQLGRRHTKETDNSNATAISENCYQPVSSVWQLHLVTCVQPRLIIVLGNCNCLAVVSFLGVPSPLLHLQAAHWNAHFSIQCLCEK